MRTRCVGRGLYNMTVRNQPPIVGEAVFDSGAWFTLTSRLNCADVMDAYGIRASIGWNRIVLRQCRSRIIQCYLQEGGSEPENSTPTRKHAIKDVTAWIE